MRLLIWNSGFSLGWIRLNLAEQHTQSHFFRMFNLNSSLPLITANYTVFCLELCNFDQICFFGFMCFLYHANLPLNTTWHSAFWLSYTILSSPLDILTNSCWWDVNSISQICLIKARRRRKLKHTPAGGHKKFSCCPFLGSQVFTPEAAKWINCNCWPLLTMT